MTPPNWLAVTADPAPTVLDGRVCRTRAAFFVEAARVLDFPAYFGHNWSAFHDCLRDLGAVHVIVAHADELLADEPVAHTGNLLNIMDRAAADGLTLTLCTEPGREPALRQRIAEALS